MSLRPKCRGPAAYVAKRNPSTASARKRATPARRRGPPDGEERRQREHGRERDEDVVGGRDLRIAEHRVLVGADEEVDAVTVRDTPLTTFIARPSMVEGRVAEQLQDGRRDVDHVDEAVAPAGGRAQQSGCDTRRADAGDREPRAAPRRRGAHHEDRVVGGIDVGEHSADELVGAVQRGQLLEAGLVVGEELG